MNHHQPDGAQDQESPSLSLSATEGKTEQYPAGEPTAASSQSSAGISVTRFLVCVAIGIATLALAWLGFTWLLYRAEHTVISNATVKGRVHRIGARIDGQVKRIDVQPGQRVSKGDTLIHLEDEHYQAASRMAQSVLNGASKRYEAEKLALQHEHRLLPLEVERCENVWQAAAGEVEAAASNQAKLEREFERISALIKAGIASASEMDRIQAERDNARALVKAAQGNLAAAMSNCRVARVQVEGLSVREAGLDVLAAEVERARQQVSAAEADLAATVIRAPEDGWVAERIVEPGGSARVGEAMLMLWIGAPWIEAWADERKLSRIGIGSPVDVALTAFPGRKLQGRVEAIGVLADRELQATPVPSTLHSAFPPNAMVPIRVAVSTDQFRLQPGLTALVGIKDAVVASPDSPQLSRISIVFSSLFSNGKHTNQNGNPR